MGQALAVQVQGQGVVSADNLNTYLQGADNAAALRSFIGYAADGVTVQVYMRGQVSVADGYQGFFYWNPTATGPDDNGVTTVVPYGASSGAWVRIATTGQINYSYQVPVTGFVITVPTGVTTLILDPAATLKTGTVVLPAGPSDGEIVNVTSTQTITSLTVLGSTGQTVKNAPYTLSQSFGTQMWSSFSYIWRASVSTWYRLS
jgi:hypothetical protein